MFDLKVKVTPEIRGLKALDERRRLGLPDGTFLGTDEDSSYSFRVDVSEAFARQFPDVFADYNDMDIEVATAKFKKGELIIDPADKGSLEPGPDLTEARLLEMAKAYMAEEIK